MSNPRLFVKFDLKDPNLQGPFQITKLVNVFNYDPNCEDYLEDGQNDGLKLLVEKIENVIMNVFPKSVTQGQRLNMIKQLQPANVPPDIIIRSNQGDMYNFNTLPSYFGECLDNDQNCKRIVFRIEFCNGVEPRPVDRLSLTSQTSPIANEIPDSRETMVTAVSKLESLEKYSTHDETPQKEEKRVKEEEQISKLKPDEPMVSKSNPAIKIAEKEQTKNDCVPSSSSHEIPKSPNTFVNKLKPDEPLVEQSNPSIMNSENKSTKNDCIVNSTSHRSYNLPSTFRIGTFHDGRATRMTSESLFFDINGIEANCPMEFARSVMSIYRKNKHFQTPVMIWKIDPKENRVTVTCDVPRYSIESIRRNDVFEGVVKKVAHNAAIIDISCGCNVLLRDTNMYVKNRKFTPRVGDRLQVMILSLFKTNDMSETKIEVSLYSMVEDFPQEDKISFSSNAIVDGVVKEIIKPGIVILDIGYKYDAVLHRNLLSYTCHDISALYNIGDELKVRIIREYTHRRKTFLSCRPVDDSSNSKSRFHHAKREHLEKKFQYNY